MSDRGVSSPVGVILLLGITIAAVTALFLVGGTVLSDTRGDAERSQTENAMAQFSSKASLVGLGEAGDQRFAMGRLSEGDVTVQPDSGQVTLLVNRTGQSEPEELNSTSLGAVVYQSGDREIAYQGGGVWERQGSHSRMLSPPEYHYRLETLTFPVMTVSGEGRSSGDVSGTVRTGAEPESWYPIRGDESRSNPLDEGTIIVRVESRYCTGWEAFFERRSEGILQQSCADGDPDTVEVDLVVPFNIESDVPVKAKSIERQGNSEVPDEWDDDAVAPSVTPEVETQLEECQDCEEPSEGGTINAGDYLSEGDHAFDGVTFDTSDDDDITVVIDGDLDLDGDIDITGSGTVTLYVTGNVDSSGNPDINTGGDASQLETLVHSDAESVDLSGNIQYTGLIYAPGSTVQISGNTDVRGAVVGDTVELNGEPNDVRGAEELDGHQIAGGDRALTYLHVSENRIEVDLD